MEEPEVGMEDKAESFFINFYAGGTMTEQNFKEGEIFEVSKLGKFYVKLTPLEDTNTMA